MNYEGEDRRIAPCKKHDDLLIKLDSKVDTIMGRQVEIKTQVERTNGRVTKLEEWKSMSLGALSVIAAILIPMFMSWFGEMIKR